MSVDRVRDESSGSGEQDTHRIFECPNVGNVGDVERMCGNKMHLGPASHTLARGLRTPINGGLDVHFAVVRRGECLRFGLLGAKGD